MRRGEVGQDQHGQHGRQPGPAPRVFLPATAVLSAEGRDAVWVVSQGGDAVARRTVSVAERTGGRVAIADGLAAGERVVVAGVNSLSDGQAVRLSDKPL